MNDKKPENWKVPVCEALIKPNLIAGVSREAFIINVTVCVIFVLSLQIYWMMIFSLITHKILVEICKKDSQAIDIFMKRYIKQKNYYYEG